MSAVAVRINAAEALWLSKFVLAGTAKDDVTPVLVAARFDVEQLPDGTATLRATSTDRYRVHTAHAPLIFDDEQQPPTEGGGLVPRDTLVWLTKNAGAYVRNRVGRPFVELTFDEADTDAPTVTVAVVEHEAASARRLSVTAPLVKGNFPPVSRLFDGVTDGEPQPDFGFTAELLADMKLMQTHSREPLKLHTPRMGDRSGRQRPFLIERLDGRGKALIQQCLLLS